MHHELEAFLTQVNHLAWYSGTVAFDITHSINHDPEELPSLNQGRTSLPYHECHKLNRQQRVKPTIFVPNRHLVFWIRDNARIRRISPQGSLRPTEKEGDMSCPHRSGKLFPQFLDEGVPPFQVAFLSFVPSYFVLNPRSSPGSANTISRPSFVSTALIGQRSLRPLRDR